MMPRRPKPKKEKQKDFQKPGVITQPAAYHGLQRGVNTLVSAIKPTLGPLPRVVVNESQLQKTKPELLDDGATIARRIIMLPNREDDMGAMYLRQMLWTLHENAGDGTATAAVLFQAIFNEGIRYISAGGNAMRLRHYLEEATPAILTELDEAKIYIRGKHKLAHLAETICYDASLAKMLGEIFDIIGEYGRLEVRSGRSRELEREYVEGMYWEGGIFSREMINDPVLSRGSLENTHIFITDLEIQEPDQLLPVLDLAVSAGVDSLLIVARTFSDRALSVVLSKPNREKIKVVAAKAPAAEMNTRRDALDDLAILTGGRPFMKDAGDSPNSAKLADLGQARRGWADPNFFGIVGGRGDPRRLREHIASLRAAYTNLEDPADRKRTLQRLGKLMGGAAVLWVGGSSPIEIETRKALAEKTAEAMRGAIREGVLPGAGVSFMRCRAALDKKKHQAQDIDERAAYNILYKAFQAPFYTIIQNAGADPGVVMSQMAGLGSGYGYDALRQKVTDIGEAGIYDAASVTKAVVFSAIHSAALALTIDILVHRKNPPESYHTT